MLAPPSAALLLIDVTAQQDDSSASCEQRERVPGSWTRVYPINHVMVTQRYEVANR